MKQLDRHYGKLDKERDRQKKQTTKHQTIIDDLGTKHTINNQENQNTENLINNKTSNN